MDQILYSEKMGMRKTSGNQRDQNAAAKKYHEQYYDH